MSIIVALALLIITVALEFIGIIAESNKWVIIAGVVVFIAIVYYFVGFVMAVAK